MAKMTRISVSNMSTRTKHDQAGNKTTPDFNSFLPSSLLPIHHLAVANLHSTRLSFPQRQGRQGRRRGTVSPAASPHGLVGRPRLHTGYSVWSQAGYLCTPRQFGATYMYISCESRSARYSLQIDVQGPRLCGIRWLWCSTLRR
jgi:hypothetical protein